LRSTLAKILATINVNVQRILTTPAPKLACRGQGHGEDATTSNTHNPIRDFANLIRNAGSIFKCRAWNVAKSSFAFVSAPCEYIPCFESKCKKSKKETSCLIKDNKTKNYYLNVSSDDTNALKVQSTTDKVQR